MISLARHIELLLLEHDCVIVPGFGGFIASHNPAQYNLAGDCQFLPPYRTIAFNQNLTLNDGLLVQSYMSAYDASYPAACLQMEKDVDRMMTQLDMKGEYTLDGVGTLTKTMNKNITFSSYESGVLTPHLYGLYSFEIHSLEQAKKEAELEEALKVSSYTAVSADTEREEGGRSNVVVANGFVGRHWKEVAVSAAAAAALFVALVVPSMRSVDAVDETVVASVYSVPEKVAKTEVKTVAKAEKPAAEPVKQVDAEKVEKAASVAEAKYALVMASCVTESNANGYIAQLAKGGFAEARFVTMGKVNRVLYSGYATENEAYAALKELRSRSTYFADAWVIAL